MPALPGRAQAEPYRFGGGAFSAACAAASRAVGSRYGEQGYHGLKRRLLWTAPRFLLQSARAHLKQGVWGAA